MNPISKLRPRLRLFALASCLLPLAFAPPARADKLTDYSAASSLLSTDIFYVVTDPGGTAATHKATIATLFDLLDGTTMTLTNKSIDLGANTVTFTSSQLKTACSDETGSGSLVFATSPTLVTPILGTPTSGTLTNCTGLPVATGISGLGTGIATFLATPGTGVATWLATPSSANLAAALTDETGSGAAVFATSPTLVTPILGTPTSGTLTNCTGLPISTGVSGLGTGIATALASPGTGIATFLGTPSSANLAAAITNETGSGLLVFATSPSLTTPDIGAATGTSLAATAAITSSSPTAGIGYATGAGSTVTQATDKTTAVTINAICGQITTVNTSMSAAAETGFTVNNSSVAATDVPVVCIKSGATANSYGIHVDAVAAGSFHINLTNLSAGSLGEALVISFVVIKGVSN